MKQVLLDGIAEILEVPTVTEATVLAEVGNWDSLAIVCTIALIDEKANAQVSGQDLIKCTTAGDVLRLAAGQVEFESIAVALGPVGGPDSPDHFTTTRS